MNRPRTPEEWKAHRAAVLAVEERLLSRGPRPLLFPNLRSAGWYLVHMDSQRPGHWRVTRFDAALVPLGHDTANDFAEAVRVARLDGANVGCENPENIYAAEAR